MISKVFKDGIVFNEDCMQVMNGLITKGVKVDMILCDLPFGTTASSWDKILPAKELWKKYEQLISDTGSIVLFAI